ncbi:hypothetical protein PLICRDRAFT_41218 [Plicaturopsis crispa FD-325 SS-3]|nr:hypothetical protein PLICRDRAFT_41218 [Plicaturopsis crispa FD-325 SS-3]
MVRGSCLRVDLSDHCTVFLDESNLVKLGDFGLSKALAQASFANTYVGTPYYMSPELMQEKAYDSKSDIWSLGCLIYELCALKPPFHEAKTHSELSIFIRNGRIPPLPRGYSQALSGVIKAMLNLNPAMRPSAAQLLQHERLELVFKVSETEKMLATVKTHKANVAAKEREVLAREAALAEREAHITAFVAQKDSEIASLHHLLSQAQSQRPDVVEARVREAVARREEELRVAVARREEEVMAAMNRREQELLAAVNTREKELCAAWEEREEQMRREVEEKVRWIERRDEELKAEAVRIAAVREGLEAKIKEVESRGRKEKTPLEEVRNLLAPLAQMTEHHEKPTYADAVTHEPYPTIETPVNRAARKDFPLPSAMKGVVFTATGEALATPTPADLAHLFESPKPMLNFTKIFDFDSEVTDDETASDVEDHHPKSPSKAERPKAERQNSTTEPTQSDTPTGSTSRPPTRMRRPSTRTSLHRPLIRNGSLPSSASDPGALHPSSATNLAAASSAKGPSSSVPAPSGTKTSATAPFPRSSQPAAVYDLEDEENLPSPFLKKVEKAMAPPPPAAAARPRKSAVASLRATAVVNNAASRGLTLASKASAGTVRDRPSIASARKATEDARKALLRP